MPRFARALCFQSIVPLYLVCLIDCNAMSAFTTKASNIYRLESVVFGITWSFIPATADAGVYTTYPPRLKSKFTEVNRIMSIDRLKSINIDKNRDSNDSKQNHTGFLIHLYCQIIFILWIYSLNIRRFHAKKTFIRQIFVFRVWGSHLLFYSIPK